MNGSSHGKDLLLYNRVAMEKQITPQRVAVRGTRNEPGAELAFDIFSKQFGERHVARQFAKEIRSTDRITWGTWAAVFEEKGFSFLLPQAEGPKGCSFTERVEIWHPTHPEIYESFEEHLGLCEAVQVGVSGGGVPKGMDVVHSEQTDDLTIWSLTFITVRLFVKGIEHSLESLNLDAGRMRCAGLDLWAARITKQFGVPILVLPIERKIDVLARTSIKVH